MMKAVALVCLLSLSMCFSQPAPADVNASQPSSPATQKIDNTSSQIQPQADAKKQNATQTGNLPPQENVQIITTSTEAPSKPVHPTQTSSSQSNATEGAKLEDNKTAPKANETKPAEPPKENKPESKSTPANEAKTGGKNETSTEKAATTKTTEAPKAATEKPIVQARGFDGPSFIGGIILTLGLLAIGFMGFKYYKNQTERNYHTL